MHSKYDSGRSKNVVRQRLEFQSKALVVNNCRASCRTSCCAQRDSVLISLCVAVVHSRGALGKDLTELWILAHHVLHLVPVNNTVVII